MSSQNKFLDTWVTRESVKKLHDEPEVMTDSTEGARAGKDFWFQPASSFTFL